MLMSKQSLQRHILRNPNIDIYECGRQDIRTGQIDRRVLATLEYLASSGLKPTVTSMRGLFMTRSASVSLLMSRIWPIDGASASEPKNGLRPAAR